MAKNFAKEKRKYRNMADIEIILFAACLYIHTILWPVFLQKQNAPITHS